MLRAAHRQAGRLVATRHFRLPLGKTDPKTPRAKKVIEYAVEESRNLNNSYVGTEHLLLGLLREHDGVAGQVLMNLNFNLEDVREEVVNLLGPSAPP